MTNRRGLYRKAPGVALGGSTALSPYNYDIVTNTYDFNNELTGTTRQHYKNVNNTATIQVTIANTYTYEHMGRKIQAFEKIEHENIIAYVINPIPEAYGIRFIISNIKT